MLRPSSRPRTPPNHSSYPQPQHSTSAYSYQAPTSSYTSMSPARYDPEYGSSGPGSPTSNRLARRWLTRRARWILGVLLGSGIVLYLMDVGPTYTSVIRPPVPWGIEETKGIWEDETSSEEPQGWGWGGSGSIGGGGKDKDKSKTNDESPPPFVVDQYGDHYYSFYPDGSIPPFDPDPSKQVLPNTLFPEITDIHKWLKPPKENVFPASRNREVISEEVPVEPVIPVYHEEDQQSFADIWKGREDWNLPKEKLRKVQWEGFDKKGKGKWETSAQKKLRLERREAVKRGFVWAWQAYKDHAWGHDEVMPISKKPSNPFNNWGASIIDTLDTLLIMGFSDEYNLCRPFVNQLNFHWLGGRDWSRGYISPPPSEQAVSADEEPLHVTLYRDQTTNFGTFETGIRYLGGLIGAYDVSGDDLMLERAKELGDILGRAFNTDSGLPAPRIDPGSNRTIQIHQVSIAEVGSMTLELVRLSQITHDRKYYDLAQRAIDFLESQVIPRSPHEPLMPQWITPFGDSTLYGTFAMGGLEDSYYEYLIKMYHLLGGNEAAEQYKRIYEASVEAMRKWLYIDIEVVPDLDLMAIGKLEGNRLIPEIEHLTCFAGAMLGLGSKLLDRPKDLIDADRFTKSCYWLYPASPTGVGPENVEFYAPDAPGGIYENISIITGEDHHPYWDKLDLETEMEENRIRKDLNEKLRYTSDGTAVMPEDGGRKEKEPVEYYTRLKGVPAGTRRVDGRYINRPETIESVYYMYRLTGDRKWQERGWQMFAAWMQVGKVEGGISSIYDVTRPEYQWSDNMESFMFAETFKYHFLLQSEPDAMSLDDYVLNTEAHPMIANPNITPGSQKFWKPIRNQHLGTRGEGTSAQKWTRLAMLRQYSRPLNPPKVMGGGKGMGGGGGNPHVRPKPPPELEEDDLIIEKLPPPVPVFVDPEELEDDTGVEVPKTPKRPPLVVEEEVNEHEEDY